MAARLAVLWLVVLVNIPANIHARQQVNHLHTQVWLQQQLPESVHHFVVIDAGSTGSRVHIYRYSQGGAGPLPCLQFPSSQLRSVPGLSAFSDRPQDAGQSLQALVEFAAKQVPWRARSAPQLHLFATAGLRLLPTQTVEAILESCRDVLAASPFAFRRGWASVLPGRLEGVYGWVAANYASGALQAYAARRQQGRRHPSVAAPFVGVMELGGASVQVTFHVPKPANMSEVQALNLPHLGIPLVTHSFLGFGQEAAQVLAATSALARMANLTLDAGGSPDGQAGDQVALDPCLPHDYAGTVNERPVVGGGDFEMCRQLAAHLIAGQCSTPPCPLGPGPKPDLPLKDGRFLAIENFYHTAQLLGLGREPSLRDIATAGQRYCESAWRELQEQFSGQKADQDLLKYCFSASYIVALLHDGFGVGMDSHQLRFTNTVTDRLGLEVDVEWPMGAAVVALALAKAGSGQRSSFDALFPHRVDSAMHTNSARVRAEFYLLAALAALFSVAMAVRLFGTGWRRPRRLAFGPRLLRLSKSAPAGASNGFVPSSSHALQGSRSAASSSLLAMAGLSASMHLRSSEGSRSSSRNASPRHPASPKACAGVEAGLRAERRAD